MPRSSTAQRSAPASSCCGCGARTGASPRSTPPPGRSSPGRSCSPPARGRGRWRATPASTSRSSRPRATTSRSRRRARRRHPDLHGGGARHRHPARRPRAAGGDARAGRARHGRGPGPAGVAAPAPPAARSRCRPTRGPCTSGAGCGRARPTACRSIGRAPGVENLVLATGHAMLGITLAPGDRRARRGHRHRRAATLRARVAPARSLPPPSDRRRKMQPVTQPDFGARCGDAGRPRVRCACARRSSASSWPPARCCATTT